VRVTILTSVAGLPSPLVLLAQARVYRYNIVSKLPLYYTQSLLQDAVEILEPMTKDSVDFVRQGAFIALGMILVEQSEASSPSLAPTRAKYTKVISDKHEDPMARFGAAIGQGFIDAGGRNVTITLQSPAGSANTNAIVGMVLFCQFWYWYPLAHCACLSFSPTGIIGLNGDLKVIPHFLIFGLRLIFCSQAPKFEYVSNAKPSIFAYPASTKPPKKETVTKVATAVLSTTAKVKAREKKKAAAEDVVSNFIDFTAGRLTCNFRMTSLT